MALGSWALWLVMCRLFGPTRTSGHVRFAPLLGVEADIVGRFETRAYWGLNLFAKSLSFAAEIE